MLAVQVAAYSEADDAQGTEALEVREAFRLQSQLRCAKHWRWRTRLGSRVFFLRRASLSDLRV